MEGTNILTSDIIMLISELVKDKEIVVEFCTSQDQVVDRFKKPLKPELFFN